MLADAVYDVGCCYGGCVAAGYDVGYAFTDEVVSNELSVGFLVEEFGEQGHLWIGWVLFDMFCIPSV